MGKTLRQTMKIVVLFSLVAATLSDFHNPDENENVKDQFLMEGDLRFSPYSRGSRTKSLWPNGVVPYSFSPKFARNGKAVRVTEEAMRVWTKTTCIKFVKRTNE